MVKNSCFDTELNENIKWKNLKKYSESDQIVFDRLINNKNN